MQINHREQRLRYHNRTKQSGTNISVAAASSLQTETGLAPVPPLSVVSGRRTSQPFPFLAAFSKTPRASPVGRIEQVP